MDGLNEGQQQARSMLPSAFQPKGKAKPQNPWKGTLENCNDMILSVADQLGKQGDEFRDIKVKMMKIAFDITKANNDIDNLFEGDE